MGARLRRVKQLVGRGGSGGGRMKECEVEGGGEVVGVREGGGGGGAEPCRG